MLAILIFSSATAKEIRLDILPVFYTYLVDYIVDGDIEYTLELMKKYRITMEYFKENMTDIGMVALFFMEFLKADEAKIERIYIIAYDESDRLVGICKIADGDLNSVNLDNRKIITFLILLGQHSL